MANRKLLPIDKLAAFKLWMQQQGWISKKVKGEYEVLRLRKANETVIIFKSSNPFWLTIQDKDEPLVARFWYEN